MVGTLVGAATPEWRGNIGHHSRSVWTDIAHRADIADRTDIAVRPDITEWADWTRRAMLAYGFTLVHDSCGRLPPIEATVKLPIPLIVNAAAVQHTLDFMEVGFHELAGKLAMLREYGIIEGPMLLQEQFRRGLVFEKP